MRLATKLTLVATAAGQPAPAAWTTAVGVMRAKMQVKR